MSDHDEACVGVPPPLELLCLVSVSMDIDAAPPTPINAVLGADANPTALSARVQELQTAMATVFAKLYVIGFPTLAAPSH